MKIIKYLLLIVLVLGLSCSPKNKQTETKIVVKENNEKLLKEQSANIGDIPFAYVVYDKYIVLEENFEITWLDYDTNNWKNNKIEYPEVSFGKAAICPLDLKKMPKKYNNYIGMEFQIYNDKTFEIVKIKNIKVLGQANLHFGSFQQAQESDNPEKVIFEDLLFTGKQYIIGEIESTIEFYPIWARSANLEAIPILQPIEGADTLVDIEDEEKVFKQFFGKKTSQDLEKEISTDEESAEFVGLLNCSKNYIKLNFLVSFNSSICGQDYVETYDLYVLYNKKGKLILKEKPESYDEYIRIPHLFEKNKEIIIYENMGSLIIIDGFINYDLFNFEMPDYDCGC